MGATHVGSPLGQTNMMGNHVISTFEVGLSSTWQKNDSLTRDFLGLTADDEQQHVVQSSTGRDELLTYSTAGTEESVTAGLDFPASSSDHRSMLQAQGFGSWRHC